MKKEPKMKDIQGYEGLYAVTEDGKVWSYRNNKWLKTYISNRGYYCVKLSKDRESKAFSVHRLVAEAFIPNPDNLPCINHKDENKLNNNVLNLEFCTVKYNNNYGNHVDICLEKLGKPKQKVYCPETGIEYESTREASRQTGISQAGISFVCNGKRESVKGFHFYFVDEVQDTDQLSE